MKWFKNWFKKKDTHSEEELDPKILKKLAEIEELEKLIQLLEETLKEVQQAKSLFNQGLETGQHGNFQAAHDAFAACLSEFEYLIKQGGTELLPDLALTRMYLGDCLYFLGNLPAARYAYENCLSEYQNLIKQGCTELLPELAGTRMNLGTCLYFLGNLPAARDAYENCLSEYQDLIKQGRTDLLPELAKTRTNLGNCLFDLGNLPAARDAYENSLTEYQYLIKQGRTELLPELAATRMNLGICLRNLGNLPTARDAYENSLSEFEDLIKQGRTELLPELTITRMNLGICLSELGNLPAAHDAYENSLSKFEDLIKQGRTDLLPDLSLTRMNLGSCLFELGNLPAARDAYENCLSEYEDLIKQGRTELLPSLARTRMNLGNCLSDEIGDYPAANIQYQASLKILQDLQTEGKLFTDAIHIIRVIADWYRNSNHPNGPDKATALQLSQQGLDWLDSLLNRVSDQAKGILLEQNQHLFYLAVDLALELNQPQLAYSILERSKSRVLVEQMLREGVEPGNQVDETLRQQYHQLRQKLRELVTNLALPQGNDTNNDQRLAFNTRFTDLSPEQETQKLKQQQAIEHQLDRVRQQIAEQDPAFGEAIQPSTLNLEQIKTLLPTKTLAIALEQRPEFLYLYVITDQGIETPLRVEISREQLDEAVKKFQSKLRTQIYTIAVQEIRDWLTEQLSVALKQLLKEREFEEILFIPHQLWHLLPLHLIQIDGELIANNYPIRYIPALRILDLIKQRPPAQQDKGIIVANPYSEELKQRGIKKLPNAEKEGQQINKLRGDIDDFYRRKEATIKTVETRLNRAKHGHFSCHGSFAPELTKAGLLLADELLSAQQLFTSIRMENPRLVVLSACETAQIQPTLADEYIGLASGFLFAGAHNVLATLWPVEDASTRLLMEDFYQGINQGLTPTLALSKAQRQLREMSRDEAEQRLGIRIQKGRQPYKKPYYWSGFVIIGDGI
jgi:CHAT domain-containing protein